MPNIGDVVVHLRANTAEFAKNLDSAAAKMASVGQKLESVGGTLSLRVTAPIVAMGRLALKAATDFESAFTGVRKTVETTEPMFALLREEIIGLSTTMPASASAIAGVAESAGQLGVEVENIIDFTEVMINLGETTNLSANQAASALARMVNITGASQDSFGQLGSAVVMLGNNLATTEAEIVTMALRISGAGAQIGLLDEEILGFAGALSSVGIQAQAGGTAISKVMIDMASSVNAGGEAVDGFAKVAGTSGKEFVQLFKTDAASAIEAFIIGLKRMSDSGEDVFGVLDELQLSEIRVRDALLRASGAGDLFTRSLALASEGYTQNIALTKEAELRYSTVASQLTIFKNQMMEVAVALGDVLLPILIKMAEASKPLISFAADVVRGFKDLDESIQLIIVAFTGAFAVTGPILLVIGAFMTVLGTLTAPILIGGAIVAGIIAGTIIIVSHWDDLVKKGTEIWTSITSTIEAAGQSIVDVWTFLDTKNKEMWASILGTIKNTVQGIRDELVGKFTAIADAVLAPIDKVKGYFQGLYNEVVGESIVPDMVNRIAEEFARMGVVMDTSTQKAVEDTEEAFKGLDGVTGGLTIGLEAVRDTLKSSMNEMLTGVLRGTQSMSDMFKNMVQNILLSLSNRAMGAAIDALFGAAIGGLGGGAGAGAGAGGVVTALARHRGGPVTSGRTALVGERGPELFRPSVSGRVIPNRAIGGGGSNVEINIINQGSSKIESRETQDGMRRKIDIMVSDAITRDLRSGGKTSQALTNTFGVKRVGVQR